MKEIIKWIMIALMAINLVCIIVMMSQAMSIPKFLYEALYIEIAILAVLSLISKSCLINKRIISRLILFAVIILLIVVLLFLLLFRR